MSEYITDAVICNFDGEPGELIKHASVDITVKEEIIRCRDCAYYHEAGVASYTPFCEWMNDSDVTPDGFCAWGARGDGDAR